MLNKRETTWKLFQHCSTFRLDPSITPPRPTQQLLTTLRRTDVVFGNEQRSENQSDRTRTATTRQKSAPTPDARRPDDVREDSIREEECPGDELLEYIPRSARGDLRQGDRSRTSTLDVGSVSHIVRRKEADEPDEQTGHDDEHWIVRHVRRLECVPRESR